MYSQYHYSGSFGPLAGGFLPLFKGVFHLKISGIILIFLVTLISHNLWLKLSRFRTRYPYKGVEVFDEFANETFKLHAMLFCTINDFPAYGNLSGYSVKGHKACPTEDTASQQLKHGRKTIYLRHRRFLRSHHPYRRLKKAFNGH